MVPAGGGMLLASDREKTITINRAEAKNSDRKAEEAGRKG